MNEEVVMCGCDSKCGTHEDGECNTPIFHEVLSLNDKATMRYDAVCHPCFNTLKSRGFTIIHHKVV